MCIDLSNGVIPAREPVSPCVGAWMAREGGVGRLIYALKSRSRPRGGVYAIAAS
jgi:hypothetical protein